MDYFVQLLISGVAVGLVYGFIGMGFAMIFRATGVVNFAQGEFLLVGAYNNETRGGSLAILDREQATGAAPAEKEKKK